MDLDVAIFREQQQANFERGLDQYLTREPDDGEDVLDYIDEEEEAISDCCKVPVCDEKNMPYCSSCRRLCNEIFTCQACKGEGSVVAGVDEEHDEIISEPCPICEGEGEIII
ncbi:hypothetical protein ACFL4H_00255 [Candidatus Neomarinimicrobiota bacterium]